MPVDALAASIASHQWQGKDNESLSSCYLVAISTTKPVKGLSGLYITKPIHGSSTSMVCPMLTKSEQMSAWHFFNYQLIFLYDIVRGKLLMHCQQCHYCDVKTSAMASRITGLFAQPFVQAQIKENIKAPRDWPLWGESNCDRWIPLTMGQ